MSRPFTVASHLVPWSEGALIRLDPSNGICLSELVDSEFDAGYLRIDNDHIVRIDWAGVGLIRSCASCSNPTTGVV